MKHRPKLPGIVFLGDTITRVHGKWVTFKYVFFMVKKKIIYKYANGSLGEPGPYMELKWTGRETLTNSTMCKIGS